MTDLGRANRIAAIVMVFLFLAGCMPARPPAAPASPTEAPPTYPDWNAYDVIHEVDGLALDRDGGVWAVGMGGAVRWNLDGTYRKYTSREGLANNKVWSISETPEGVLWFGTDAAYHTDYSCP